MSSSTSFIDPASLGFHAPSPAPSSSYTHDDDHDDESHPRKRQRTTSKSSDESSNSGKDLSLSEQRKEARAHRNRIAAQNSRDRRKAQFGHLERRVAELEEENRRLRAGIQLPPTMTSAHVSQPVYASQVTLASVLEDRLRAERERERERENEELKARIRTLEQGWEAVVKALTAQGLPAGLGLPAATPTVTSVVQPTAALPSPAPSNASLDFEQASPLPTTAPAAPAPAPTTALAAHDQTTRHLARVATTGGPSLVRSVSLQRVVSAVEPVSVVPVLSSTPQLPPYLRALQLKNSRPLPLTTTTRRWRPSLGRYSRRRVRHTRPQPVCLLKVHCPPAPRK